MIIISSDIDWNILFLNLGGLRFYLFNQKLFNEPNQKHPTSRVILEITIAMCYYLYTCVMNEEPLVNMCNE